MDELDDKAKKDPGARSAIDEDRHSREMEIKAESRKQKFQLSVFSFSFNPCEAGQYDTERD